MKAGLDAAAIITEAANPMEVLQAVEALPVKNPLASRGLFGAPAPEHPETGSMEYMAARRGRTASDIADRWENENSEL